MTNEELLQIALHEADDDSAWQAIMELQHRGDRDVFELASKLCTSPHAHDRCVGVDILSQLGIPTRAFPEEALSLLLTMLGQEQESDVLYSIGVALGHQGDPCAIQPLTAFKRHADEGVRFGVVFGLMGHEDDLAILTLIELSTDKDAHVRDWATFSLGSQIELDTPSIHEALVARLTDTDEIVRGEAMVGLARRHDQRVIAPLLADLEAGWCGSLLTEAAAEIGDPRLYPALVRLKETWEGDKSGWLYEQLEEAIKRCKLPEE